jgi:acetyltransferase-like isoleucine patch superfamily enzyme
MRISLPKIGFFYATYRCKQIGNGGLIHPNIELISPKQIKIGKNCEIRKNCVLDARSKKEFSILIGDNIRIKDNVNISSYGGEIHIGSNVLIGRNSTIFGHGNVKIGNNSMISPNVSIISSNHICYISKELCFQEMGFTRVQIDIGNNVWIGCNSVIIPGAIIPDNVIIGAGSVVNKILKPNSIYAGNPVKFIKNISSNKPDNMKIYFKDWGVVK